MAALGGGWKVGTAMKTGQVRILDDDKSILVEYDVEDLRVLRIGHSVCGRFELTLVGSACSLRGKGITIDGEVVRKKLPR